MLGATAILLIQNGNYVLQYRDDKPEIANPNTYATWGGAIEQQDDSPEAGAVRELLEETKITCTTLELLPLGTQIIDDPTPSRKGQKVNMHYFYLVIPDDLQFSLYEGQGKAVVPIPYNHAEPRMTANSIVLEAIRRYEAQAAT